MAKEGKKRKRTADNPLAGMQGWQKVEVGDELLIGSEEGGFLELEEFKPTPGAIMGLPQPTEQQLTDTEKKQASLDKKPKKKKKLAPKEVDTKAARGTEDMQLSTGSAGASAGGEPVSDDVAALKAQLAKLQAENAALKEGNAPGKAPDPNSARSAKLAAKRAKAKEIRQVKKEAAKARKLRAAARSADDEEPVGPKKKKAKAEAATAPAKPKSMLGTSGAPAVDMAAWEGLGLGPGVLNAIAHLGFAEPTPIQRECLLPAIRDRRDVIGAAQTGSGKTLAFGLPILQLLLDEQAAEASDSPTAQKGGSVPSGGEAEDMEGVEGGTEGGPSQQGRTGRSGGPLRALILAPTRELAMQVSEHLQAVAKPLGVWVAPIVGGISPPKQARLLGRRPAIVVATPGRLWELMRLGEPHLADLTGLSFLVLDEADRMVQQGHFQELANILEYLESQRAGGNESYEDAPTADRDADDMTEDADEEAGGKASAQRRAGLLQTFVFSATLTLPQELRKRLRRGGGASGSATLETLMDKMPFRPKPKVVDLTSDRKLADKVVEACVHCSEEERDEVLYYMLAAHPGRTLVFVNAVSTARRVAALLRILQMPSAALHAGMQQRARLKALERFRTTDNAVLVASDVAARGLDIPGVRCVVHYQIPASADVYVHRCGRTARAAQDGLAVALVTPREAPRFTALLRALERGAPPQFPLDPSLLPACRARVRLALRLDTQLRSKSKSGAEAAWLRANAEAAGIQLSDDEDADEDAGRARTRGSGGSGDGSSADEIQKELQALLAQPLQAKFSRKFFTGVPSASLAASGGGVSSTAVPESAAVVSASEEAAPSNHKGDSEPAQPAMASTVADSVKLAQQLEDSRTAAKEKQAAKKKGQGKSGAKTGAAKPGAAAKTKRELEAAALAAAMERREKKRARGRSLIVASPAAAAAAFGRATGNQDALAALRSHAAKK
ncbi:DEAD-box ATP-dependent RNA helicase 13 [Coccomyxa sp. Obi]|nr:DEAD-box ATP-dependent RNA helicase 13 [Coccomyxa sp. Obi]